MTRARRTGLGFLLLHRQSPPKPNRSKASLLTMGQRHQAFLVARVVVGPDEPAEYRCVAAVHHQWCYGSLPLRAVYRFYQIAKQNVNAALLREDLRMYAYRSATNPEFPCQYAALLLQTAWGVGLDDKYISSTSPIHVNEGCWYHGVLIISYGLVCDSTEAIYILISRQR